MMSRGKGARLEPLSTMSDVTTTPPFTTTVPPPVKLADDRAPAFFQFEASSSRSGLAAQADDDRRLLWRQRCH